MTIRIGEQALGFAPDSGGAETVLYADSSGTVLVPPSLKLGDAEFARQGANLLITAADGAKFLVRDYFDQPVALSTPNGGSFAADLVLGLAGPQAPGQYAQANTAGDVSAAAASAPIGRVTTVDGEVSITRVDGTVVELAVDSLVFAGDVLVTSENSAIGLVFNDQSIFSMGADSRMILDKLVYNPESGEGSSTFSVVKGIFSLVSGEIGANNPDAMVVRTPGATLAIRGTKVAGDVDETESSFILLQEANGYVGAFVINTNFGEIVVDEKNVAILLTSPFLPPKLHVYTDAEVNAQFGGALGALGDQGTAITLKKTTTRRTTKRCCKIWAT